MRLFWIRLLAAASLMLTTTAGAQIGASVAVANNEVAPSLYVRVPIDSGRAIFELNLLPFTVIPHDRYNDTSSNVSMLPLIRSIPVALGIILVGGHDFGKGVTPESSAVRDVVMALILPFFLTNAQIGLPLGPSGPGVEHPSKTSIFFGMRTDYFKGDVANWYRFAPMLGVEFSSVTGLEPRHAQGTPFAVQVGIARRFDVSGSFAPKRSTSAFVTLMMGIM
jgi:hypothetical protein